MWIHLHFQMINFKTHWDNLHFSYILANHILTVQQCKKKLFSLVIILFIKYVQSSYTLCIFAKFLRYPLLSNFTFLLWCSQKTRILVLISRWFSSASEAAMEKWSQTKPWKNSSFVAAGPGILPRGPCIPWFFKELLAFSSNLRQLSSPCHFCPSIYNHVFSLRRKPLKASSFHEFLC